MSPPCLVLFWGKVSAPPLQRSQIFGIWRDGQSLEALPPGADGSQVEKGRDDVIPLQAVREKPV